MSPQNTGSNNGKVALYSILMIIGVVAVITGLAFLTVTINNGGNILVPIFIIGIIALAIGGFFWYRHDKGMK